MKTIILAAAIAAASLSSAAHAAGEGRIEARGGIGWVSGVSSEVIGLALGYDFDVGSSAFIGLEGTIDTDFDFVDPVVGLVARAGARLGEDSKLFVSGGYSRTTGFDLDDATLGVGYQQGIGKSAIFSIQYQRYIDSKANRVTAGLGLRF